jgi:histidine ammonia-lyase
MGTISARKAATIISHVQSVLAVELICAAQAIDFKDSSKLGKGTRAAYELLRSEVTFMETDRAIYLDMNKVTAQIRAGKYVQVVEQAAGTLR